MTLNEFYYIWIDGLRGTVKANTIRTYSCAYKNHISDKLGNHIISNITHSDIINMRSQISSDVSSTYKNFVITVLKMILAEAVRRDLVNKNAAAQIRGIKVIYKPAKVTRRFS